MHRLLFYISLPLLRDYDVKLPNFSNMFLVLNNYSSSPNVASRLMKPKAEWAIASEAMKARGIITSVEREVKDSRGSGMYQS